MGLGSSDSVSDASCASGGDKSSKGSKRTVKRKISASFSWLPLRGNNSERKTKKSSDTAKLAVNLQRLAGLTIAMLCLWVFILSGRRRSIGTESNKNLRINTKVVPDILPKMGHQFYFAYASDMLEDRMRKGSSLTARQRFTASLPNHMFEYPIFSKVWRGGVGDLIPSHRPSDAAWGVVWEFPETDIPKLDKQKGIGNVDPKYEKVTKTVRTARGDSIQVFTYTLLESKRTQDPGSPTGYKRIKPSRQYRGCVVNGAKEAKLPGQYVENLKTIQDNGETFRRKSVGMMCG